MINIQVVYALAENPTIIECQVNNDCNVLQAIEQSHILSLCNLTLDIHQVGIYGNLVTLDHIVNDGDRIEIYRPLLNDPKEIRLKRANNKIN